MGEQSINLRHCIQVHNTSILSTKLRYMDCIIREATEIRFHPNNKNTENGFCLSKSWKPLISNLKDHRKPPSHNYLVGLPFQGQTCLILVHLDSHIQPMGTCQAGLRGPSCFCIIPHFYKSPALLAPYFLLVSYLVYSSVLRWRRHLPLKHHFTLKGLYEYNVISQKIEIFITTAVVNGSSELFTITGWNQGPI
jgi:hypothetical protein